MGHGVGCEYCMGTSMDLWNVYGVAVKMYYKCTATKWMVRGRAAALCNSRCAMYDVNEKPRWLRVSGDLCRL
jgi:hypothetical protein